MADECCVCKDHATATMSKRCSGCISVAELAIHAVEAMMMMMMMIMIRMMMT